VRKERPAYRLLRGEGRQWRQRLEGHWATSSQEKRSTSSGSSPSLTLEPASLSVCGSRGEREGFLGLSAVTVNPAQFLPRFYSALKFQLSTEAEIKEFPKGSIVILARVSCCCCSFLSGPKKVFTRQQQGFRVERRQISSVARTAQGITPMDRVVLCQVVPVLMRVVLLPFLEDCFACRPFVY